MKAWTVSDYNAEYGVIIVFAETRGKAKQIALNNSDQFEDCIWTDLWVRRFKDYDEFYTGEELVDFWNDVQHRIRLVKDFGWSCIVTIEAECINCPAREWCRY